MNVVKEDNSVTSYTPAVAKGESLAHSMNTGSRNAKAIFYQFLLTLQILGAVTFVWQQLPEFRHIAANPGRQLPQDIASELITVGALCVMQIAFWCRVRYIQIPMRRPNMILSHVFLFLGRLSFIFGSALFSLAAFRHLPELGRGTDVALAAWRSVILIGGLFALFCASLEVERLGQSFDGNRN